MNNHPVGEIGEGAARWQVVLEQDDLCQALLVNQLGRQVFEHQRQKTQPGLQAGGQGWLGHRASTQERQAAGLQLPWVHAKELVVPAPRQ
ncbi:hypothetical protein D3C84_638920 [compost metagenome]